VSGVYCVSASKEGEREVDISVDLSREQRQAVDCRVREDTKETEQGIFEGKKIVTYAVAKYPPAVSV
jgi:hypothetical protein